MRHESPQCILQSTKQSLVDLSSLRGITVVYCFPLTGVPNKALPEGWNGIPGARGCTPQSCAYRDLHREFAAANVNVFGLSVQSTDYQLEMAMRLRLPFGVLSDEQRVLSNRLRLPSFSVQSIELLKRVTLAIETGRIVKAFYPIFPPQLNAEHVLDWLVHEFNLKTKYRSNH
jgi:peroxiredoxin